jgi:hypothetical protein
MKERCANTETDIIVVFTKRSPNYMFNTTRFYVESSRTSTSHREQNSRTSSQTS